MNRPLEKAIYKYIQEYKRKIKRNKEKFSERKMCRFVATRLTVLGKKKKNGI
ncbi:MAG: hypothetical protein ACFFAU_01510 [Candidatus Hodarchaeota archaeon]